LQEIPGVDPEMVESIRDSVTSYYGQFEDPAPAVREEDEGPVGEPAEAEPAVESEAKASPAVDAGDASLKETGEPQDIEMAGESDTIEDSEPASHDDSENSGSQNE
jgi:hypothetical protein